MDFGFQLAELKYIGKMKDPKSAEKIMTEVDTSMKLELQGVSAAAKKELLKDMAQELIQKEDRRIWRVK